MTSVKTWGEFSVCIGIKDGLGSEGFSCLYGVLCGLYCEVGGCTVHIVCIVYIGCIVYSNVHNVSV